MSARRAGLAALALALLLAPGAVTPVAASWSDAEYAGLPVVVASSDCTDTGLYTASAASALLAGTVQGVSIGSSAATAGVVAGPRRDASTATSAFTTAGAGSTPSVSGVALPLVLTSGGSWNQSAGTNGRGASTASISGTSPLGSVGVSALLARSPASSTLPTGLADVALDLGAPAATASYDACAAGWGSTSALARSSSLSALSLRLASGAVTDGVARLRADGTSAGAALTAAASTATAPVASAAGAALLSAVSVSVGTLALATVQLSGSAATITPSVTGIPDAALGSWRSGAVALDAATGTTTIDLLPAGTSTGPDRETITSSTMTSATGAAGSALQQSGAAVAAATATARDAAPVGVTASVKVFVGSTAAATVTLTTPSTRADTWARTGVAPQVTVDVLSSALLGGLASTLGPTVASLLGTLPSVKSAVSTEYLAKAPSPAAQLASRADAAAATLGGQLSVLPGVLSAVADERATSAATSWTGALASGVAAVSALRLQVRDGSGTRLDLFVGNAAVGPNRPAGQ